MGGSSNKTTQTTTAPVPEWMSANGKAISTAAMGLPTTYTSGQPYAATNPGFADVRNKIASATSAFQPWQSRADTAVTGAYNANQAQGVQGPNFSAEAIARFKNPFDDSVINKTIADMGRARSIAGLTDNSNAAAAGAFGGARHGVQAAETTRAYDDNTARTIAGLNQQGYNSAVSQYNTDYGQGLQAAQINNAAAGQNYGQGADFATRLASLGQQGVANQQAGADAAFRLTASEQAKADADAAAAENARRYDANYGYDALMKQASINAGSPYSKEQTTVTSTPTSALGPVLYGLGSATQAFASDERTKENVAPLDPEDTLGAFAQIPTVSYDYKGAFAGPNMGRRDGFMAQDYERAFGETARTVDGPDGKPVKTIDVPQIIGRLVSAVKGLEARTRPLKGAA